MGKVLGVRWLDTAFFLCVRSCSEERVCATAGSGLRRPKKESGVEPPHSKGRSSAAPLQNLDCGAEVAGGEVVERLETANQLDAGYTTLAVERAQKVGGGALALAGVAFAAARDQVAVRVGTEMGAGYDVIEALHLGADAAEAVKADAPFAGMDGLAELGSSHKVDFLEVAPGRRRNGHVCVGSAWASARNLFRQPHLHDVASFAALDQPQGAVLHEPA